MAVEFPTSAIEVVNRQKADVQNALQNSNPFLKNSLINALVTSYGYRNFDTYNLVNELQKQFFPQTAEGQFLDYFAQLQNVFRRAPTASKGEVVFSGSTAGTQIPIGSTLSFGESTFTTLENGVLSANTIAVSQITQTAGLATITFANNHELATGVQINISGCIEAAYNGTKTVTVINVLEATFPIDPATSSPATTFTTIQADYNVATIEVQSQENGSDTNVSSGGKLTLNNSIVGVNDNAYVTLDSLSGGADEELEEDYRLRVIDAWQNPVAHFNAEEIRRQALQVGGVTRVFVQRATQSTTSGSYNKNSAGFVTVYFVKDEEPSIIPDGQSVQEVKDNIMSIAPMTTVSENVFVEAPVAVPVNLVFASISPDTTTMRTSIEENIRAFFRGNNNMNSVNVGFENLGTVFLNDLNLAILQTVDSVTGQPLLSYNLNSPNADIVIQDGEITTQGSITFL